MDVSKGDIYWVRALDLDIEGSEQQKSRPYVIASRTKINRLGRNVVGVPLSTKLHKAGSHRLLIQLQHMVPEVGTSRQLETSVALTDHIRVLDVNRLERPRMGRLSDTAIYGLEGALAYLFDIR